MAVAAKKKGSPEESIHVKLGSPKAIRKEILTLAISLIELLKRHEAYLSLKTRKVMLMKQLSMEIDEIKRLFKEFNIGELPISSAAFDELPIIKKEKNEERNRQREVKMIGDAMERDERRRERAERKQPEAARKSQAPYNKLEADLESLREKLETI